MGSDPKLKQADFGLVGVQLSFVNCIACFAIEERISYSNQKRFWSLPFRYYQRVILESSIFTLLMTCHPFRHGTFRFFAVEIPQ